MRAGKPAPAAKSTANQAPVVRWLCIALFAVTLVAYINSFQLGVALDGHANMADRRTHAATAENVSLIFTKDYWWPDSQDQLYRPITKLSFLFNHAVLGSGNNPAGYHALNIALHAANVALVFALALRLLSQPWPAFFAACIWAVHPIGVDAVSNLAGRADLLAALGVLGGLLLYARLCDRRGRPLPAALGIFVLGFLAVGSKENGAVLIGLMLLWDVVRGFGGREGVRRRIPAYAGAAAALLLFVALRVNAFRALPVPVLAIFDNPLRGAGFWEARWSALKILAMDLRLLVWPLQLAADRSLNQTPLAAPGDPVAWAGLLAAAAILAAVIVRRRRDPLLFWGAGFFAIALVPVSNLFVLIGAPMAERFLYLPAVGFAVAAVLLVYRFAPPRTAAMVLGAVVVLFAARTLARNPDWDNDLALTSHDSRTVPQSARIRVMHGEFLFQTSPANIDRAISEEEAAWSILAPFPTNWQYPLVPMCLGRLYGVKGDMVGPATPEGAAWHAKALPLLERAVTVADASEHDFDDAQLRAGKPLPKRLAYQNVYFFAAVGYRGIGRNAESVGRYRQALAVDPTNAQYYAGIADAYAAMGDKGKAVIALIERGLGLGLTPEALADIGRAYATLPDGACAVSNQGGVYGLDPHCPRVPADVCAALENLAETYTDARDPQRTEEFRNRARQSGCGAR